MTATLWSIAATFFLLLLLLDLDLVIGLLIEQGRIDIVVSASEAAQVEAITGGRIVGVPIMKGVEPDSDPIPHGPVHISYGEQGLLPAVWHTRHTWWGPLVAWLYGHVSWLQSNVLALIWLLSAGVLLFVLRNLCLLRFRSYSHLVSIEAVMATRRNIHRQVLRLGPEDLDGTGYKAVIHLFAVEVELLRHRLDESISKTIRFPMELAGLSVVLLSIDWRLTLQWIAPLVLGFLLLDGIQKTALRKKHLANDLAHDEEQTLLTSLKNARITRGMGIEQAELERFQKHLDRYHTQLMVLSRATDRVSQPRTKVVAVCTGLIAFLLFLVFDKMLVSRNVSMSVGMIFADLSTFLAAIVLSIPGVRAMNSLPEIHRELKLTADKVLRYLDQIPAVSQAVGAKFLQPMSKTLHFENVKYETPGGRKILTGVDFKLEVDKAYALVSVDPIEARAIALMLPRFIEPREGRVMIDGEDIAWVTLESLRAETIFVAADDQPFEGTVLDNIRGGQTDLTLQQVTEAAKMTHAHNFIVKLFNGYETVLTGQTDSLDVGQRFRLGLARAIVRDPALLIIEEPSESLDEDTKTLLVDAYDRICRERTVIFLPARMSTVRRTEQVIVLYEGKVVAIGPHAKLITQSPVYRHWEYLRFNEFRQES